MKEAIAKVFEKRQIAIGGYGITDEQFIDAINRFNKNHGLHGIEFAGSISSYDAPIAISNMAATANLYLEGETAFAKIRIINSPMGELAEELLIKNSLYIRPFTDTVPNYYPTVRDFAIRKLIFEDNDWARPYHPTPAQQVKAWVTGEEILPLFKVKEHKY